MATAKEEAPGDLLAVYLRVRGDDGAWTTVPFLEASAGQVRQAVDEARTARRQQAVPKELRDRLGRFNRDVPKSSQALRKAKVAVARDRSGQVLVSMSGVPLAQFAAYAAEVVARLVESEAAT